MYVCMYVDVMQRSYIKVCNLDIMTYMCNVRGFTSYFNYWYPGGTSSSLKAQVYQYEMTTSLVLLTSDPTLLGNILLDKAKTFASIEESEKSEPLVIIQTLDSHIYGISQQQPVTGQYYEQNHCHFILMYLSGFQTRYQTTP